MVAISKLKGKNPFGIVYPYGPYDYPSNFLSIYILLQFSCTKLQFFQERDNMFLALTSSFPWNVGVLPNYNPTLYVSQKTFVQSEKKVYYICQQPKQTHFNTNKLK